MEYDDCSSQFCVQFVTRFITSVASSQTVFLLDSLLAAAVAGHSFAVESLYE